MSSLRSLPHSLSELPSREARLCLQVRRFLESVSPDLQNFSCIVAFSGGADSTALALILHCLGVPLTLAHLDHCLREESGTEAADAARFAAMLGVPFQMQKVDVAGLAHKKRTGLEEAGREARYIFFEDVRIRRKAGWIAVGHHLDDLSEDVLMRLVRGVGWPGLGGMRAVDEKRRLIRPLLGLRKEKLLCFLRSIGVSWTEDTSNGGTAFRRNRIRNRVLPLLREENPAFSRSVLHLWELAQEDEKFWESQLIPVLRMVHETEEGILLPRSAFVSLPKALRLRVFAALIRRMGAGQARSETLFSLDAASMASRAAKLFRFPGKIFVRSDERGLLVGRDLLE